MRPFCNYSQDFSTWQNPQPLMLLNPGKTRSLICNRSYFSALDLLLYLRSAPRRSMLPHLPTSLAFLISLIFWSTTLVFSSPARLADSLRVRHLDAVSGFDPPPQKKGWAPGSLVRTLVENNPKIIKTSNDICLQISQGQEDKNIQFICLSYPPISQPPLLVAFSD